MQRRRLTVTGDGTDDGMGETVSRSDWVVDDFPKLNGSDADT
jgi:hypothetical protein